MITVTKTYFPPIEEYQAQLRRIWDNKWLTNRGELVRELEHKLKDYLDIHHIIAMTNGTLPIQIALNAFGNQGEIITTPFSYVATTSSIVWEKCTPVFVDIHPEYLTIDETKIEAAITDKTTAILATHVFGNPCDVEAIERIAKKHDLKVIYDAAHCFGVSYKGTSVFNYGDVSTCSFHATKLFHSGEGGALICNDDDVYKDMFYRHNFGHANALEYHGLGINAKMSELQGAMGLSVLPYMDTIMAERKKVVNYYNQHISNAKFEKIKIRPDTKWNYAYYPLLVSSESELVSIQKELEQHKIFVRRYFSPSLEDLPYVNSNQCPIAKDISSRVMCLPLYVGLTEADLDAVVTILQS